MSISSDVEDGFYSDHGGRHSRASYGSPPPDAYSLRELEEQKETALDSWGASLKIICVVQLVGGQGVGPTCWGSMGRGVNCLRDILGGTGDQTCLYWLLGSSQWVLTPLCGSFAPSSC